MGLSVKKERGVNTSVIAPLFCPQSLDNLFEDERYEFSENGIKFTFVRCGLIVSLSAVQGTLQSDISNNITLANQIPDSMRPVSTIYLNSTSARMNSNIELTLNASGYIRINRISGTYSFGSIT